MTNEPTENPNDELAKSELARIWQEQEIPVQYQSTPQELVKLTQSISSNYKSQKRLTVWLNFQEIVPAIAATVFFAWLGISESDWLPIGSAILCAGVGLFLLGSSVRQHRTEQVFESTLRGSIEKSLSQNRWALWMYRNVGWWYLMPLGLALVLTYISAIRTAEPFKPSDLIMWVFFATVFGAVYWWNQRIASNKYEPEVARLESLLSDLQDPV